MLDAADSNGVDTSYPPRFDCEKMFKKDGSNLLHKRSWKNS